MALESYKQKRARVESEQAPTVAEGLEDWQKYREWHEPADLCGCGSCRTDQEEREKAAWDAYHEARRNAGWIEEERQKVDCSGWSDMGEQV